MRRALFLSLSPPEVARSVFYKKDHEKKMTHMLKKKKMTHMEGKEKALVLSGAGAHILAPPGETSSCPLRASSSSWREGRQSADLVGSRSDNGNREGALGVWHVVRTRTSLLPCLQRHKAAPLSLQLRLHPWAALWEVDVGPFFQFLTQQVS